MTDEFFYLRENINLSHRIAIQQEIINFREAELRKLHKILRGNMSPYNIATQIRQTYNHINNFTYKNFDSLEPEMRSALSTMLQSLSILANNIEREADEEFEICTNDQLEGRNIRSEL